MLFYLIFLSIIPTFFSWVFVLFLRNKDQKRLSLGHFLSKIKKISESASDKFKLKLQEELSTLQEKMNGFVNQSSQIQNLLNLLEKRSHIFNQEMERLNSVYGRVEELKNLKLALDRHLEGYEHRLGHLKDNELKLDTLEAKYIYLQDIIQDQILNNKEKLEAHYLQSKDDLDLQKKELVSNLQSEIYSLSLKAKNSFQEYDSLLNNHKESFKQNLNQDIDKINNQMREIKEEQKIYFTDSKKEFTLMEFKFKSLNDEMILMQKDLPNFQEQFLLKIESWDIKFRDSIAFFKDKFKASYDDIEFKFENLNSQHQEFVKLMSHLEDALKNQYEKKLLFIDAQIDERFQIFIKTFEKNKLGFEKKIEEEFKNHVDKQMSQLNQDRQKIDQQAKNIHLFMENFIDSESAKIKITLSDLNEKIRKQQLEFEKVADTIHTHKKDVEQIVVRSIDSAKKNFENLRLDMIQKIKESLDHLYKDQEKEKLKLEKDIRAFESEMRKLYNSYQKDLENSKHNVQHLFQNLDQKVEGELKRFYQFSIGAKEDISRDLNLFKENWDNKYKDSSQKIEENLECLNSKIENIDLVASKKLKDFQEQFTQERKKISNYLAEEFKNSLSKWNLILKDYDTSLQDKLRQSLKDVDLSKEENLNQIMTLSSSINEWKEKMAQELLGVSESYQSKILFYEKQYQDSLAQQVQRSEKEMEQMELHWNSIQDQLRHSLKDMDLNKEENLNKIITLSSSINEWKEKMAQELLIVSESYQSKVLFYEKQYQDNLAQQVQKSEKEMEQMELHWNSIYQNVQKDFDEKVNGKITYLEKIYEDLKIQLQKKMDSDILEFSSSFEKFKEQIYRNLEKDSATFNTQNEQLRKDFNALIGYEEKFSNIAESFSHEIDAFENSWTQKQNKLYEQLSLQKDKSLNELKQMDKRICEFKQNLPFLMEYQDTLNLFDEKILETKKFSEIFEKEKKELEELKNYIQNFYSQIHELKNETHRLKENKEELLYINHRIEQVLNLNELMDEKIKRIDLKLMSMEKFESRLKNFENVENSINNKIGQIYLLKEDIEDFNLKLNDLKKKNKSILFEMNQVKFEYQDFLNKNQQIREDIHQLIEETSFIEKDKAWIKDFIYKFDQMDAVAMDMDHRIEQFSVFKKKLSTLEQRFKELSEKTDQKVTQFSNLNNLLEMKKENLEYSIENKHEKKNSLLSKKVLDFYKRGFDFEKISKTLNVSKSEIELILGLDKKTIK